MILTQRRLMLPLLSIDASHVTSTICRAGQFRMTPSQDLARRFLQLLEIQRALLLLDREGLVVELDDLFSVFRDEPERERALPRLQGLLSSERLAHLPVLQ